ncbi:hypothetical protein K7X08_005988 [Anisodus acutangulus]|uniref:Uncharacterized protein n=1 Tax=Anisodus acutangulus TaxID=402998 RepID=A0A9Q1LUB7_9SOLA|nr:hypothetical protein K7X08_005988 [Anisodus acutangulus]
MDNDLLDTGQVTLLLVNDYCKNCVIEDFIPDAVRFWLHNSNSRDELKKQSIINDVNRIAWLESYFDLYIHDLLAIGQRIKVGGLSRDVFVCNIVIGKFKMARVVEVALTKVDEFNSQNVAGIAEAFASMQHFSPELFLGLARRALDIIYRFQPQEIAQILWDFVFLCEQVDPPLRFTNISWDFMYVEYVMAVGNHHRLRVWQISQDNFKFDFLILPTKYYLIHVVHVDASMVARRCEKNLELESM